MHNRTLLIAVGIAVPLLALALVAKSSHPPAEPARPLAASPPAASAPARVTPPANNATRKPRGPATLAIARQNITTRLAKLETMTAAQWPDFKKTHPKAAPTLEKALENNRRRLAELNLMTEQQWASGLRKPPVPVNAAVTAPATAPAPAAR